MNNLLQAFRFQLPTGRDGRQPIRRGQSRARPRRLDFANDPDHLAEARARSCSLVKGGLPPAARRADTQRIDVRARVDVEVVQLGLLGSHVFQRAHDLAASVNRVRSVNFWAVALATPKSITFGTGFPSYRAIMMFEGLRSR